MAILTKEQYAEFEKVTKPVIQWLNENAGPHSFIIIDIDSARYMEGFASIVTDEFVKD